MSMIPNILDPGFWRQRWNDARLAWRVFRDPRVPRRTKILPLAVIFYLVSPFDIIPGFIPVIGQIDDLALLFLGLNLFVRLAPQYVVDEHKIELGIEAVK